jgi:hypothetical protein
MSRDSIHSSRVGRYKRWLLRISVHQRADGFYHGTVELWRRGQAIETHAPVLLQVSAHETAIEAKAWAVALAERWIDTRPLPVISPRADLRPPE